MISQNISHPDPHRFDTSGNYVYLLETVPVDKGIILVKSPAELSRSTANRLVFFTVMARSKAVIHSLQPFYLVTTWLTSQLGILVLP